MAKIVYEKGIIKVVWIEDNPLKIYSKMFDDLEEAKRFAKSKEDYIIFALVKQNKMRDFEWRLLPFGKYRLYKLALRVYRKYGNNIVKFLRL